MMQRLWLWWQGYVTIRISGLALEQFLNKVAAEGIQCWSVERLTNDVLIARVLIRDFLQLRPALWNTQVGVTILDRHGFPFFLKKVQSRAFLGVGLILSLGFMVYFSSFIWFIEISGNETIPLAEIKAVVEREGLKIGTLRKNLNLRQLETALLIDFPNLVWTEIDLTGVKAAVNLAERENIVRQEEVENNLYAEKDGLITEILVLRGTPKVKAGDTVRAGDLLIAGEYYDQRGKKQVGVAEGVVKARIWYQGVGEAPFVVWDPQTTGKTRYQFLLTIGSFSIPFGRSYNHVNYQAQVKEWCLPLGKALFPIKWTKITYHQVEYIPTYISQSEARSLAIKMAWEHLRAQGVSVEKARSERLEESPILDDEGIHVELWVEVEEDLGRFSLQ